MRRGENIYQRKDGRWEGRYKKGRKADGKVKYGYVYGKTLQEVRVKLYPLKVHYQTIQKIQGSSCIPFEEWGYQWLQSIQYEVKPSTYANYHYKLIKYVFPFIGNQLLNELNSEIGKQLVQQWVRLGLKASTMKAAMRIVCQCLNHAKRLDHLKENPFSTIKMPKEKKKKIRSLTKKEQQNLEKVALKEGGARGLPTYLALYTGLRIGEIAALRWSNIDFERDIIHVNNTYQRLALTSETQKTQLSYDTAKTEAAVRIVPFGMKLKKQLLRLRKQSTSLYVFSKNGRPMEPRLLTYHFHRLRDQAGIQDIHFHQLRHTFATRCLEAQGDILSVSAMLGHTSTQLTLDTYADSMMEQRMHVIVQLEKILQ
ncbi:tyrosine-type recombinase/integrase [Candidatus Enterococcus murrayae]|uniref:Tyrosine-type recombinase/integrase n=1 Tax=Candidatus Enterococcus murrayae TaxID=2815321 RepID=A0ABS3HEE6_9ENTE|nr:site-specific integrase [Enterococcus sp. MJM16]MBO0451831.1 tyrosine-type recombinase/integrase [Enterococcus sp. MJM16]